MKLCKITLNKNPTLKLQVAYKFVMKPKYAEFQFLMLSTGRALFIYLFSASNSQKLKY